MLILPASDVLDGRCVRLRQGRFDEATIYSESPVDVARASRRGSRRRSIGERRQPGLNDRIRGEVAVPLQIGDGVRDVDAGRVVKGVRFRGLRDAGDPMELAGAYEPVGAGEILRVGPTESPSTRRPSGAVVS